MEQSLKKSIYQQQSELSDPDDANVVCVQRQ